MKEIDIDEKNSFRIADKLFIDKKFKINDKYRSLLTNCFASDIGTIDATNAEKSAKEINKFVDENTKHKIKEIVTEKDLRSTNVVLANVVYFGSEWAIPYPYEDACFLIVF